MKKIGIITHYYLSNNYGGNLQAYALVEHINKTSGFAAEQICYCDYVKYKDYKNIKRSLAKGSEKNNQKLLLKEYLYLCKKQVKKYKSIKNNTKKIIDKLMHRKFIKRERAIRRFNHSSISHSVNVYYVDSIINCGNDYDEYITGSDQVWSGCSIAYTLGFVAEKPKLSYAASLGRSIIPQENKDFLQEKIKDYTAVSVRSKDDQRIVSDLTEKKVEIVLDPAFLLTRDEWEKVATKDRRYKKKYLFSYFLGDNKEQKKLAKRFANKKKLKVVNIAHFKDSTNEFVFNDLFFGDYKPYDVSPADFISLIRDAEYIFTDSFHALVFSVIYHKQFFAFERISKYGDMNARLLSLLEMIGLNQRFCDNVNCNLEYINSIDEINYNYCDHILDKEIQHSKEFLCNNI